MSETKHTPGPWTLGPCLHGGMLVRRGDQTGRNTHIQSSIQILPTSDAYLIAAAPDLLAALKGLLLDLEGHAVVDGRLTAAEAAIAKAEGRS